MKKITKLRRSIRAISPVISVLLMIAVAVVASLVAYAWVMGYMGFQTNKVGKAVQIQSSAFNTPGTELTIYVQNVGQGAEQLNYPSNTVYINDVARDIIVVNPSGMLAGNIITVPEGQTVGLTVNYPYTEGEQLKIKIVTVDGTAAQQTTTGTQGGPSPTSSAPPGNTAPSAGFTFSATNLVVQFTDASTDSDGTIASRLWAFGDTQTSTETNPSHTYAAAGTYTVRLTVTDDDGATNYVEHSVTVAAGNVAPTAAFTFAPANPTTATTITFTDGSSDSDGTIASRTWTFGDGGTSTLTNPTHQYTAANTYTVRLTVTDDDGATNYIEHTVVVTAAPTPQTITLLPSGDGQYNSLDDNWQGHSGWECVKEASDVHYVYESTDTSYQTETYTIDDMPSGTINSVTVYVRVAKTTPTDGYSVPNPNAMIRLRLGSTDLDGTAISISSTTFTEYSQVFANKPGGSGWTYTDINNLQAGIRLQATRAWHDLSGSWNDHYDYSEARCSQIWIVVNYTPT